MAEREAGSGGRPRAGGGGVEGVALVVVYAHAEAIVDCLVEVGRCVCKAEVELFAGCSDPKCARVTQKFVEGGGDGFPSKRCG